MNRTFLGDDGQLSPSRQRHHRCFIGVKRAYFKGSLRFRGNNGPNEKLYKKYFYFVSQTANVTADCTFFEMIRINVNRREGGRFKRG